MRLFAHPIHPALVHFPVAFWTLATVCDGLAVVGVAPSWQFAGIVLALGLVAAIPAMFAGLIDFSRVPDRAAATANWHMILMGSAWTAYLTSLLIRLDGAQFVPKPELSSVALSSVGFALMAAGGWYGGQLVYHHGVGTRFQNQTQGSGHAVEPHVVPK